MTYQPWDTVFLIGLIVFIVIRAVYARRNKGDEKLLSRTNGGEKFLLILVLTGSLILPVLYLFTPWLNFAAYSLPQAAHWCGVAVMVPALWLFWRSHVDLGKNWSITLEILEGHAIVQQGVYRSIRHPMYTSIWLFGLAQGLLLPNWLAGWSALVSFAVMYVIRVPREEAMMCEHFGQAYQDYMKVTGRLWPRVGARRVDEKESSGQ